MNVGEEIRDQGFDVNSEFNGKTVTLANGAKVFGFVEDCDAADQAYLLGEDLREYVRFHFRVNEILLAAKSQDIWILEDGTRMRVTKRVNNPGNPYIRFYAIKVGDKDK